MSVKRTAIIFVIGVALAGWLAAAMTPERRLAVPTAIAPSPIDSRGAALADEIARLHDRLRPDVTPRQASRNPFVFRSAPHALPSPSIPSAAVRSQDVSSSAAAVDHTRLRLSLAGIAEDPGSAGSGPARTAIIVGNGQVFLAKEGDTITDRAGGIDFKVGAISSDSAELTDLRSGVIHRLALK
jgi:hypothetical protein